MTQPAGYPWCPGCQTTAGAAGCKTHNVELWKRADTLLDPITSWTCSCGWVNGINLDHCARCKRSPDAFCTQP